MLLLRRWVSYLLAVLLISMSMMLIFNSQKNSMHSKQNIMDTFGTDIIAQNFSATGQLQDTLTTPYLQHYTQKNMTVMKTPYIVAQAKKGPPWHVSSQHGYMLHGQEEAHLWNHVKITQPPGLNSENATLLTSALTYYPKRGYVETDKPVTLLQPGTTIHAVGMTADLKRNKVDLLHHVTAQHNDQPQKDPHKQ